MKLSEIARAQEDEVPDGPHGALGRRHIDETLAAAGTVGTIIDHDVMIGTRMMHDGHMTDTTADDPIKMPIQETTAAIADNVTDAIAARPDSECPTFITIFPRRKSGNSSRG